MEQSEHFNKINSNEHKNNSQGDILGIHHVTAIASDPQKNIDFYTQILGLRLVKLTVNFDDPTTYHLYFGDEIGRPGTILTFFPWPNAPKGHRGTGQVITTSFLIPERSIDYWDPYNPLQQLTYFGVIFLLGPFMIATGAAMSPAIAARFPRYQKLFRGRQVARSLHFLGMLAFVLFIIVHITMVTVERFPENMGNIVLGNGEGVSLGIAIGLFALLVVSLIRRRIILKYHYKSLSQNYPPGYYNATS
jgi:catechol 2,3-dioxygenase-like lactoylglutathione lyase family enzyme